MKKTVGIITYYRRRFDYHVGYAKDKGTTRYVHIDDNTILCGYEFDSLILLDSFDMCIRHINPSQIEMAHMRLKENRKQLKTFNMNKFIKKALALIVALHIIPLVIIILTFGGPAWVWWTPYIIGMLINGVIFAAIAFRELFKYVFVNK